MSRHRAFILVCIVLLAWAAVQSVAAQELPRDWLVLGDVTRAGRSVRSTDAIELSRIRGTFEAPEAGDRVTVAPGTTRAWATVRDDDGIAVPGRGYAYGTIASDAATFAVLHVTGASRVYVDGEPRIGDMYRFGTTVLPIFVRAGGSELLIKAGRGKVSLRLEAMPKPIFFTGKDMTIGDVIVGESGPWYGSAVVALGSDHRSEWFLGTWGREFVPTETPLPPFVTPGTRKALFTIEPKPGLEPGDHELDLLLYRKHPRGNIILDRTKVQVRVRRPSELHKRTFVSDIDGSVQYYAVQPSLAVDSDPGRRSPQALFLSLHGASVEATNQAASYARKSWGHVVCPTNRRPYGFDWQFLGRLDALEVLEDALARYEIDETAVYLTGHSMGGHGTWHVGVTMPDHFAAIGPSAGWCSFATYGRRSSRADADPGDLSELDRLLIRAANPSDTLLRKNNYAGLGIYVLHGDADKTVPVREAREMRLALADVHRDLEWHEQKGADHWWDDTDEPGAGCVDYAPMFDFFARHRRPRATEVREVDFTTVNPADASRHHWAEVLAQQVSLAPSRVRIRFDPHQRRFVGSTENVALLALDVPLTSTAGPVKVRLDFGSDATKETVAEVVVDATASGRVILRHEGGAWKSASLDPRRKNPRRAGPFQHVFRDRVCFVYGTQGDEAQNSWARAKARFDAESLWYRGNGSVDVVSDTVFLDPNNEERFRDRNVVVYGNSRSNAAWLRLLGEAAAVSDTRLELRSAPGSGQVLDGDDLAILVVRPRAGTSTNLVAGIGGTGIQGMRLTEVFPYFVSGVHYPDVFVARPTMLDPDPKVARDGIVLAGFYDEDWR
ncbi:MAG: prolyl oligopeptidase family serine peptidase [Planctomycetes bacterium]|nr:prolyl oligopeptidase family serine peptidase [Planctomycetota bacterium]